MMAVRLTPKAEAFLRDYLPTHFQTTGAIMAALTEGERKTLVALLGKVQGQAATLRHGPPGDAPALASPAVAGPAPA